MSAWPPSPVELPEEVSGQLRTIWRLFEVCYDICQFGESVRSRVGTLERMTDYRHVAYLIFGKSFRTFQGAIHLGIHGYGADGLALCASLFENLVDLTYVEKGRQSRSAAFLSFEQLEKYCSAVKVLQSHQGALKKIEKQFYEDVKQQLQSEALTLLPSFPNGRCPRRGWSGKTLADRAKDASKRLAAEYDMLYYTLCSYKHTSPAGTHAFVLEHSEGTDVIAGPHINGVYSAALVSAELFLRICRIALRSFGLTDAEVNAKWTELQAVAQAVRDDHPELCE